MRPKQRSRSRTERRGFTIVSVIVAIILLTVGLLALAGSSAQTVTMQMLSQNRTNAIAIARGYLEQVRTRDPWTVASEPTVSVDAEGKTVPTGEPGEILVRGYNVMKGYFEDEAATRERIDRDGWLHTGDVGTLDAAGNLRITDRIKDMYIMGGFNCYPAEIENLMFAIEGIAQVAVIGVPDERMGEVGMAFVVPVPGQQPTPESLLAWCRQQMANYKVPRRIAIVDALPQNASGKVTKFALRERAAAVASGH